MSLENNDVMAVLTAILGKQQQQMSAMEENQRKLEENQRTREDNQQAQLLELRQMVVKLTHSAVKNEKSDDREESSSENEMMAKRGNDRVLAIEAIESRIQEFVYEPEEERTFELWWSRHSDIFEVDLASWDDVRKVRLLLRHVHAKCSACSRIRFCRRSQVS